MLAASRAALGDDWLAAWNVAPIWRFALPPGDCGPDAALGLWMPSVDRVGRQFPLTFAAVAAESGIAALIRDDGGFLARAEAAGLDAIAAGLDPGDVAARLAAERPSRQAPRGSTPALRSSRRSAVVEHGVQAVSHRRGRIRDAGAAGCGDVHPDAAAREIGGEAECTRPC